MLSELVAQLNGLPDARRGAGKRHPVGVVLVVAIMSVLSGMWSYRAMGDFVKANKEELCRLLHVSRHNSSLFALTKVALYANAANMHAALQAKLYHSYVPERA